LTGEWLPPQPPGGEEAPQPPPEYPQQPAPGYPPPAYPPPGYQQPGWQPPAPQQPPNNEAVAGFTCGIIGVSLLFFTAGLSTIVSLVLGIVAIPYARKGKRNVEEGRTLKHKSLASAGLVIGIVTVVMSVLATIGWILVFALVDWDEIDDSDDDPFDGDPFDNDFQSAVLLRVAAAAVRLFG
jgi:hypothetical protein